jgi:hypothetical protein
MCWWGGGSESLVCLGEKKVSCIFELAVILILKQNAIKKVFKQRKELDCDHEKDC